MMVRLRFTAFILACWLVSVAAGAGATSADVASAMADAARAYLASLDEKTAARATMAFDDPKRLDWHNIPKDNRKGVQVRDMTAEQQKLCHALLKAGLSEEGYAKAARIMSLENNLKVEEKGKGPFRDPQRYYLTIFGKPDKTGSWGFSFEGHHLSLNFAIKDGIIIGDTPSFWGACPAIVHNFIEGGPQVGTRTLAKEEQAALDLIAALDDAQRTKAVINAKAPADYQAAGKPKPPADPPAGLPAADMNDEQKKLLVAILDAYNANLAKPLADARSAEIKADGIDKLHLAWAGATKAGVGHYFRIQGPSFVLELVNIQSDPSGKPANHIHSVWRSLKRDFGTVAVEVKGK